MQRFDKIRTRSIGRAKRLSGTLLIGASFAALAAPVTANIPENGISESQSTSHGFSRTDYSVASGGAFETDANETSEILFPDGSSITLAPNTRIRILAYEFDPATGEGSFRIALDAGAIKVNGGLLNQRSPISIETPYATLSLENGSAFATIADGFLRTSLLVGGTLNVGNEQGAQTIVRPGYEVRAENGQPPQGPTRQPRGQAFADAAVINPGLNPGRTAVGTETTNGSADQLAETDVRQSGNETPDAPPPPPPPTINNSDFAINIGNGAELMVGQPSAGDNAQFGTSDTGDAASDILITQYSLNTIDQFRTPGLTTNRILPDNQGQFDFSSGIIPGTVRTRGGGFLQTSETDQLSYLVSSTLLANLGDSFGRVAMPIDLADVNFTGTLDTTNEITLFPGTGEELVFTFDSQSGDVRNFIGPGAEEIFVFDGVLFVEQQDFGRDTALFLVPSFMQGVNQSGERDALLSSFAFGVPHAAVFERANRLLTTAFDLGTLSLFRPIDPDFDPGLPNIGFYKEYQFAFGSGDPRPNTDSFFEYQTLFRNGLAGVTDPGNDIKPVIVFGYSSGFAAADQWDHAENAIGFSVGATNVVCDILVNCTGASDEIDPRDDDNFLAVAIERADRTEFFATGEVGQGRMSVAGPTIDSFAITRGLNPNDFDQDGVPIGATGDNFFRAFLPDSSLGDLAAEDLFSTNFFVVNNSPDASGDMQSRFFHADFGLSDDGRISSISLTLGSASYDSDGFGLLPGSTLADPRSLVLSSGRTIASNRSPGAMNGTGGTALINQQLIASAIGGGGDWGGNGQRNGFASSIVFENVSNLAHQLAAFDDQFIADALAVGNALRANADLLNIYTIQLGKFDDGGLVIESAQDLRSRIVSYFANPASRATAAGMNDDEFAALIVALTNPALEGLSADQIAALAAGGSFAPLIEDGTANDSNFGILRMATGLDSMDSEATVDRSDSGSANATFNGYVAGLHQNAGGNADALYNGTITLDINAVTNSVGAVINYSRPSLATLADGDEITAFEDAGPLNLGDSANGFGESAFVDLDHFGALVANPNGANAALVSGEAVKNGLGAANAALIDNYQHVQWGFFFGDLLLQGTVRTHTPLSTWVAGRRADAGDSVQGSASYQGHAIGTVVSNQTDLYTAVGTFEQMWNLDSGMHTMSLDFDNRQYTGSIDFRDGPSSLSYGGNLDTQDMLFRSFIDGELVEVIGTQAFGTIGAFRIRGIDNNYFANGTFAGDCTTCD